MSLDTLNDQILQWGTAEAWSLTVEECVQAAYDVIKSRTGKMVDGKFVKDN